MSPEATSPTKFSHRVKSESLLLSDEQEVASDATSNYEPFIQPPPPSYEVAVMDKMYSPTRIAPLYFPRYRHDPYNARGICFEPDF